MIIKLTCKFGGRIIKIVSIVTSFPICVLLDKLKISDKNIKYIFGRKTYSICVFLHLKRLGCLKIIE